MPRLTLAAVILFSLQTFVAAETFDQSLFDAGAGIFRQQCADCHGGDGQGSESGYEKPLFGDEKISELVLVIEQTMPEDDPSKCVGDQAKQVTHYLYHEFYSLKARRRKGLAPRPRIELSRLTVEQHRNAIADLIATFTPQPRYETQGPAGYRGGNPQNRQDAPTVPAQRGLRGAYFQSRGMNKADDLRLERVDRQIEFDFDTGSPLAEISADQFAVIWDGSVSVRDTGYHEFRIHTENGVRFYVNHGAVQIRGRLRDDSDVAGNQALIDAWVSSGQMREETARIFLVGGRRYPLRLEFFKYLDDSASIRLEWKPPGGVWRVMNHHELSTAPAKRQFVADVPFPADDRSLGYERGTSVSSQWHLATNEIAVAAASEVVNRLPMLAEIESDTPDRQQRMAEFAKQLAARAYRRPLTDAESSRIEQILADHPGNLDEGLLRVLLMVFKSPSFLYSNLPINETHPSYAAAATLALVMWDSIPDRELISAAKQGEPDSGDDIRRQAKRMLTDARTRAKLAGFFRHWLEVEERDLAKDRDLFPEFDEAVIADLRTSLFRFVDHVVWSERSDYRELLQADYLILNDRLRTVYDPGYDSSQVPSALSDEFRQFQLTDQRRAGVLTHPYLLSAFSYHNNTSPVHRGVFLTRNIVGRALKPPPEAVAFKDEEFADDLTMREKVTLLTRDSACMACHSVINPLGFALENYDPVGRFRTAEGDKPLDTKTQYVSADGKTIEFQSAVDIAKFAVESEDARRAFVKQLFLHLVKQDPDAFGEETTDQLVNSFAKNKFNIQNLMVEIAVVATQTGKIHD